MVDIAKARSTISSLLDIADAKRLLKLRFPDNDGPKARLLPNKLVAEEYLSKDFKFTLELLSDKDDIELKSLLGKQVSVELIRDEGKSRFFNGYCFTFSFIRAESSLAVYEMVLGPWAKFLHSRTDYYLFHGKSIVAQTKEIFEDYGVAVHDIRIKSGDPVRTMSCQYGETDYNYLHRRWEEMGWHYWYEHNAHGHRLVLSDNSPGAEPIDGGPDIAFHHDGSSNSEDKISRWSPTRHIVSGGVSVASYDFKAPTPKHAKYASRNRQGDVVRREVYEYTGAYGFKDRAIGEDIAKRRMEAIDATGKHVDAQSENRSIQPGRWFCPVGHFGQHGFGGDRHDVQYLVTGAIHTIYNNFLSSAGQHADYKNEFTCIRRIIPWLPQRGWNSTDTKADHTDTVIVTGPPGEEIYTDEYARVKVQFHWDRVGKNDEKSSAWIRVASTWAGSNFGAISIPRVGQEVVIAYLRGNPDHPIVTGSMYNKRHMPPWDLPANKTQSGVLTRSSQKGSPANANALRFEDKKSQEEVWLHAEKNQRIEVENDESHWVGHDRTKTIDHDETVHVKNDRTETVDHDEKITVHNNRTERVDHNEKISVGGNRTEDVGKDEDIHIGHSRSVHIGDHKSETVGKTKSETVALAKFLSVGGLYQITVGGGMNTTVALAQAEEIGVSKTVVVGKTISISAGEQLKITVGKSSITMHAGGRIEIEGTEVLISGSKKVEIHGKDIDNNPA